MNKKETHTCYDPNFSKYLMQDFGINEIGASIIIRFLVKQNINPDNYPDYIKKITKELGISQEILQDNKIIPFKRDTKND